MVEIRFVDGTIETVETGSEEAYEYNTESQMFKVLEPNGYYVMCPREFVKSIRYIEV